jgi:hypothetical protein
MNVCAPSGTKGPSAKMAAAGAVAGWNTC